MSKINTEKGSMIDDYGDFVRERYFLYKYQVVPSHLDLELSITEELNDLSPIIGHFRNLENIEIVYEKWKIGKRETQEIKDYQNYYFLEAPRISVCIVINYENKLLSLTYLYDVNSEKSLEWIRNSYKELRRAFGGVESPVFNVLSRGPGGFYTEEIVVDKTELDVELNYNDDFYEVDEIIKEALDRNSSGLILMHGPPGTGKTTYIKYLLSRHSATNFIFVPNNFVNELLQPDFISFLISNKNSVLVIEDAEKVISSRDLGVKNSVVSTILQLTDGLFSDYLNIKIICTFNTNIKNIDSALLRKGRMIAFYEFGELSLSKTNNLLHVIGLKTSEKKLTLAEIYKFRDKSFIGDKSNEIGFK